MKDVTIIEDVLPKAYWQEIHDLLTSPELTWNYSEDVSLDLKLGNPFPLNPEIIRSCGFTHTLCVKDQSESPHWDLIRPLIYFMAEKSKYSKFKKPISTFRAKVNLQTQLNGSHSDNHNMPHIDPANFENEGTNWVFLYYVTEADGDTFIFNEISDHGLPPKLNLKQRVSPKPNSGILFRDNLFHASSNPIKHQSRIAINLNLVPTQ